MPCAILIKACSDERKSGSFLRAVFLCGRSVDKEATAGLGRRHPGDEICGPLVRARRLGDIRNRIVPLEPLRPAACRRQGRQNLQEAGFPGRCRRKKGARRPGKARWERRGRPADSAGRPAACRLRLCSQNEILCGHDTCEPSQTRYGCGAIACIFVVLREAYVGTGGSYVGTESKQFS